MTYLIDTSVLARRANATDAQHTLAAQAVLELHRRAEVVHLTPQVLIEFRNVATRPVSRNGLGLPLVDAEAQGAGFESAFPLLVDTPDIYPTWKALVIALGVIGKQVHDARLVAVCHVHGVKNVLTFNTGDFVRMAGFGPGVVAVHPSSV